MMRAPVTGSFLSDSQLVCLSPYWCHSPKWSGIGFPTTESIRTCKNTVLNELVCLFCTGCLNYRLSLIVAEVESWRFEWSLQTIKYQISIFSIPNNLESTNANTNLLFRKTEQKPPMTEPWNHHPSSTPKTHKSNTSNHPSNTNQSFPT